MPIKRSVDLHFRVGPLEDQLIDEYAEEHGMTRSEVLRLALNDLLRRSFPDRFMRPTSRSSTRGQA